MKKAVKTVSFMVVATMLAKIMGMVRDAFIANCYGTSIEASAYMNASQLPISFFDLTLGAAILSTFIPVFNRFLEKGDKQRAFAFSNSFINLVMLVSAVFCIAGIVFSKQIAYFFVPASTESALMIRDLTAQLLIILFPTTFFTAVAYCFVGILQSFDEFNIPAIISLVSNVAIILYLVFFNTSFGIFGLAAAMVVGWALQVVIQIPSLIKKGYKYRFTLNFRDEGIRDVFVLALPILLSSWLQPLTVLINKRFASYISGGQAVSGLDYANRLYIIIVGVFAFGITNYIFPSLSRMSGEGNTEGFAAVMEKSLRVMVLIIAPIMAGMMLLSNQIVTVIYARGQFDAASVTMTATALLFYSLGMVSYSINEILNKCFFAMENGKTPMIASVCGIGVAAVLSYLFIRVFGLGIGALALSAAISTIVVSAVLLTMMHRKVCHFLQKDLLLYVCKVIFSTAVMAVVAYVVRNCTAGMDSILQIVLTGAAGAVTYFGMVYVLKIEELREVLPKLR